MPRQKGPKNLADRFKGLLGEALSRDDMSVREIAVMLAEEAARAPVQERAPEVTDLLARIRSMEARNDGGWPGGDVVDILTEWFPALGYDIDGPVRS